MPRKPIGLPSERIFLNEADPTEREQIAKTLKGIEKKLKREVRKQEKGQETRVPDPNLLLEIIETSRQLVSEEATADNLYIATGQERTTIQWGPKGNTISVEIYQKPPLARRRRLTVRHELGNEALNIWDVKI